MEPFKELPDIKEVEGEGEGKQGNSGNKRKDEEGMEKKEIIGTRGEIDEKKVMGMKGKKGEQSRRLIV